MDAARDDDDGGGGGDSFKEPNNGNGPTVVSVQVLYLAESRLIE